jgi:hypothetical protein
MALVKVLVANLFAGAGFQKLEAGQVYDADDSVAEKWIAQGKAEKATEKKGEKLTFEVATPSAPVSTDTSVLQSKLNDALEQLKTAQDAAEAKDEEHAAALEQLKTAQDAAEAKDEEHAAALEQLKTAHATEIAAANDRADKAEAALTAATKKDK